MLYNMKTKATTVAKARRNFAMLLANASKRGTRIKVRRYRTTLAGIVPRADLYRLDECDQLLAKRPRTRRRTAARPHK
jgi:hypothetical protein